MHQKSRKLCLEHVCYSYINTKTRKSKWVYVSPYNVYKKMETREILRDEKINGKYIWSVVWNEYL